MIGRAFQWVRAVVLLACLRVRVWWLERGNVRLRRELAVKTRLRDEYDAVMEERGRDGLEEGAAKGVDLWPDMVLLRHSIDQCLAQVRDEVYSWPEARLDAYVEALQSAVENPGLSNAQRLAARMQYVAVQMVALESAEAKMAGGGS